MSHSTPTSFARPAASVANDPSLRVLSVACGLTDEKALPATRRARPTVTTAGLRLIGRSLRAVDRQATALRRARSTAHRAAA
jgi:hypothetical protein